MYSVHTHRGLSVVWLYPLGVTSSEGTETDFEPIIEQFAKEDAIVISMQ